MWTTKITNKEQSEGKLYVTVEFDNGTEQLYRKYVADFASADDKWLKRQIAYQKKQLDDAENLNTTIELGDIEVSDDDITDKVDVARQVFSEMLEQVRRIDKAISLGLIAADAKIATDAKTKLKSKFKNDYLDLL